MEKTPKAQSLSQFHHKYPDRVSGAELIVRPRPQPCRKPRCQPFGGRRLGQEAPGAPEASADLH